MSTRPEDFQDHGPPRGCSSPTRRPRLTIHSRTTSAGSHETRVTFPSGLQFRVLEKTYGVGVGQAAP
jgi:hypothetical protein